MKTPWWVPVLLRMYPEDFRRARSTEVEEMVRAELSAGARRRGVTTVWLAWDLARGAVRLRVGRARGDRRSKSMNREGWMMAWMSDLRLAVRGLARNPGFTAVVVITLALGVGLNTALFSVVDGVLLRPLSYEEPEELVYLEVRRERDDLRDVLVSGGDWRMLRDGVEAFETVQGFAAVRQNLSGAGLPRQVQVGWVSPGFLGMLGVTPVLGRLFTQADPPGTVVLAHSVWEDAFGRDPDVLGRSVTLDGHPYTVVGVMPRGFRLELPRRGGATPPADIWKNPDDFWQNGDAWAEQGPEFGLLRLVGRLADGATVAEAQAQVDGLMAGLREEDARYADAGFAVAVEPLHQRVVGGVRSTLLLLLGAVGFVLLIACANVANLLLVRGQGRRRELAVRLALGSPRHRLGSLLLTESLTLALWGGLGGLAIAVGFVWLVPSIAPAELPRLDALAVDGRVLAYALGSALVTTFLVGTVPALVAVRTQPGAELGNGRSMGGRGGRLRDGLVVVQVALSLMLLAGAGLLMSSLVRLNSVEPGFDPEGLFTYAVSIPGARYGWPEEAGQFYREVQSATAGLPGVEGAGVVWPMPFGGTWSSEFEAVDGEIRPLGLVPLRIATEEYFPAAGIPVLDGRLFREGDARHVVVMSEAAARDAFPDGSAIGRTIRANPWGPQLQEFEVIGVVGDVRSRSLREAAEGALYFDVRGWSWVDWEVHVVARTATPPAALIPSVREAVARLDGEVPVAQPETMSARLAQQTAATRFVLLLLGAFAATAGVLAVVGLYGVVGYTVGLRRREIGIRMALGSARTGIERMVVARGMTLAGVGVGLGLAGAVALGDVLESLLFGVRPGDPLTLAAVGLAMALAATLASWLPARRAAKTDPVEVLKAD